MKYALAPQSNIYIVVKYGEPITESEINKFLSI